MYSVALLIWEKEGAFDEAAKGVDAFIHVASPAHFPVDGGDPDGR